jgi:hypothetical protein
VGMFPACRTRRRGGERHEGKGRREAFLATGEGKPLKVEAQGRYPHETRREGFRAEQGVRRLRKPGGAAQPGEASPVWVAARFLKRRRAESPMEGRTWQRVFGPRNVTRNLLGSYSERQGKGMRGLALGDSSSDAGSSAENHGVRGRFRSKFMVGALNQYGARSAVLNTL